MLYSTSDWASPVQKISEQYRLLADWMEKNDELPWHVGTNWSKDALLVHLQAKSFLRLFQGRYASQNSDTQGVTWTIASEGLLFTSFIPHSPHQNQQLILLPPQKESA